MYLLPRRTCILNESLLSNLTVKLSLGLIKGNLFNLSEAHA